MSIFVWGLIVILLALIVIVGATRKEKKTMDSAALQSQVSAGTPIDISQVRALEQRLIDEIAAGHVREQSLQVAFETYTQGLLSKLSDITQKYTDLFNATNAVNGQDFTQDMAQLQQALEGAQAIGIGTLADFTPPAPPAAGQITVTPGAGTGGDTSGDANGVTVAAPIDAADAAAAAQTAQDQASAAARGAAMPVAVPPGATVDTHSDTGVVTVTLPAGTPVVQAAAADTTGDQTTGDQQQGDQQAAPEGDSQQQTPEQQQDA